MDDRGNGLTARDVTRRWVKSSFSGPTGNCVEVAFLADGGAAVRNSRHASGPALVFSRSEWDAFLRGVKAGEFGRPG